MSYRPIIKPISQIIKENPFQVTFRDEHVEKFEIAESELKNSIEDIKQRLSCKLKTGLCSSVLIKQIAIHHLNFYEKFGDEFHHYHVPTILETIEMIETGLKTRSTQFKKTGVLAGLKHAHHNANTFTINNIYRYWKEKFKGQDEIVFQNKLLKEIYKELLNKYPEHIAQQKCVSVLLTKIQYESKFQSFEKKLVNGLYIQLRIVLTIIYVWQHIKNLKIFQIK